MLWCWGGLDNSECVHRCVDRFHFPNHVDAWCRENLNPNDRPLLDDTCTEACDETFSWLCRYRGVTLHKLSIVCVQVQTLSKAHERRELLVFPPQAGGPPQQVAHSRRANSSLTTRQPSMMGGWALAGLGGPTPKLRNQQSPNQHSQHAKHDFPCLR